MMSRSDPPNPAQRRGNFEHAADSKPSTLGKKLDKGLAPYSGTGGILIIQQKMIGDVLTSTVMFEALRLRFPDAQLHFLVQEHTLAVVEGNPFVDKIIVDGQDDQGKPLGLFAFCQFIRSKKYGVVIDVYNTIRTGLICGFSGAKIRSGRDKWYLRLFYNHLAKYGQKRTNDAGLAIQFRLKLLEPLGIDKNVAHIPKVYLTRDEIAFAKARLHDLSLAPTTRVVMLGFLGSNPLKTYPLAYLAELLELIVEKIEVKILLNYLPNQAVQVQEFLNFCSGTVRETIDDQFYVAGLREFIAVTSLCDALVGNEGGAVHMARAVGIPTFAIYSPQINKGAWSPSRSTEHMAVHLQDFKPEILEGMKDQREIRSRNHELYEQFTPDLIKPKFKEFISQNLAR